MSRAKYILCMLIVMHASSVSGQTRSELREMFVTAESDILFEDYAEALPKYLNLLQMYPENYNFYFRVGQCYLNTPGEKENSLSFLETAAEHINPRYHGGRFSETGAPYDALYYLANAYRINNNLDKAIETYDLFMKDIDIEVYDTALVKFQIETCHTARKMMLNPIYVVEENLGNVINERFSEFDPVVSADESMIVFTRALQFYDAVFYSRKLNGRWTPPVNMTPLLGVDQDYYSSSLTDDGKTLFLYRTDKYEGNIYLSRFSNDSWSKVEKLNDNINTKYWESHATMSKDGRKLYFTSNKKESMGGLDIFVSERDTSGNWGPAINLGPVINTIYNEESPFLANNDRSLFFSSRGHYNMGGYDIFRSDMDASGKWGTPVNIGYPVNTTDDDLFFTPVGDGNRGYYARFDPDGFGKMDIFRYEIFSDSNPRSFYVTGIASIDNLLEDFPESIKITAVNNADTKRAVTAVTDPATGQYSLSLPQGSFSFTYSADGASTVIKNIEMPLTHKGDTIRLDPVALASADFLADLRVMGDTALSVTSGDPILFNLILEAPSLLKIELFTLDTLMHSESHRISDTTFSFNLTPPKGNTRMLFSLRDKFGNIATAAVNVYRKDVHRSGIWQDKKSEAESILPATNELTLETVNDTISPSPAGSEENKPGLPAVTTSGHRYCWLWWLSVLGLLIIIYIIWRSRRKNKNAQE